MHGAYWLDISHVLRNETHSPHLSCLDDKRVSERATSIFSIFEFSLSLLGEKFVSIDSPTSFAFSLPCGRMALSGRINCWRPVTSCRWQAEPCTPAVNSKGVDCFWNNVFILKVHFLYALDSPPINFPASNTGFRKMLSLFKRENTQTKKIKSAYL